MPIVVYMCQLDKHSGLVRNVISLGKSKSELAMQRKRGLATELYRHYVVFSPSIESWFQFC